MLRYLAIFLAVLLLLAGRISAQDFTTKADEPSGRTFGVGFGIPYGIIGVNVDFRLEDYVHFTGGVGSTVFAGVGYNVGVKYFLTSPRRMIRPRISAYYGTNSILETEYFGIDKENDYRVFTGLTIGFGLQFMPGRTRSNGFDLDLMYVATSGLDAVADEIRDRGGFVDEPSKIKLSLGYRHAL